MPAVQASASANAQDRMNLMASLPAQRTYDRGQRTRQVLLAGPSSVVRPLSSQTYAAPSPRHKANFPDGRMMAEPVPCRRSPDPLAFMADDLDDGADSRVQQPRNQP